MTPLASAVASKPTQADTLTASAPPGTRFANRPENLLEQRREADLDDRHARFGRAEPSPYSPSFPFECTNAPAISTTSMYLRGNDLTRSRQFGEALGRRFRKQRTPSDLQ